LIEQKIEKIGGFLEKLGFGDWLGKKREIGEFGWPAVGGYGRRTAGGDVLVVGEGWVVVGWVVLDLGRRRTEVRGWGGVRLVGKMGEEGKKVT
jgi:hypothetical protein